MGRLVAEGPRCVLRGTTGNPAMVAGEWLAAIPYPFRVIGGPELRDAVAEVARRMRAAAGPRPRGGGRRGAPWAPQPGADGPYSRFAIVTSTSCSPSRR